jgi:putative ABC transport system permease protein
MGTGGRAPVIGRLYELARLAVQPLVRSPGRSGLTVLGLAIGVGAFIAMLGFGEGARRSVVAQFEALGTHVLRIRSMVGRFGAEGRVPQPLTARDVTALRREASLVETVVPVGRSHATLVAGGLRHPSTVHGTTREFLQVHAWRMALGGPFDHVDVAERSKVCVLGATPARVLFGHEQASGQRVTIDGLLTCRVLGVLEEKGLSTGGDDIDDLILVPVSTFEAYFGLPLGYSYVQAQPYESDLLWAAEAEVRGVLRRARRLSPAEPDDFTVDSPAEVIRAAESTALILQRLLAAIAAVSLLVGGIGIMNIQLVSVAERTREIGIRAAVGASPAQIQAQFLTEAVLLSAVGTLLGVALGVGVSIVVGEAMGFARTVSWAGVLIATALGLGAGVVFGYVPARRASLMDPIEALRRE